ncbi:MAG: 3-methylornithyl-N6-L-lysine dehydrogenase PylD [Lentihominibacter sp.]|jgi:pyrrolysine biosynthesis protein PylD
MTRLITDWISDMEENAADWNEQLKDYTGMGYIELAAAVSGTDVSDILNASETIAVAAVPVTCGEGVIGNFAESVAAIVRAMGFKAFVTESTDVDGLYEAKVRDAGIVFMADDFRYVALNLINGKMSENNMATAYGYAEIMRNMAGARDGGMTGALNDKPVAVLGYGIVGQLMAERLASHGARVAVYEKDETKKAQVNSDGYLWINRKEIAEYNLVADATCEGGWLSADELHDESSVLIAAPGIPLLLDEESANKLEGRYIHDMLEIGTAVMLGMVMQKGHTIGSSGIASAFDRTFP